MENRAALAGVVAASLMLTGAQLLGGCEGSPFSGTAGRGGGGQSSAGMSSGGSDNAGGSPGTSGGSDRGGGSPGGSGGSAGRNMGGGGPSGGSAGSPNATGGLSGLGGAIGGVAGSSGAGAAGTGGSTCKIDHELRPAAGTPFAYVGTENGEIHVYELNVAGFSLIFKSKSDAGTNPSFLAMSPPQRRMFAANEAYPDGELSAFSVDQAAGTLTFGNRVSSSGSGPAHIAVDRAGKFVFATNYATGNIVTAPIQSDGKLGSTVESAVRCKNPHQVLLMQREWRSHSS